MKRTPLDGAAPIWRGIFQLLRRAESHSPPYRGAYLLPLCRMKALMAGGITPRLECDHV